AWADVGSPACSVPFKMPGGKPVTAVPGLTPRSPVTLVAPVLVTVEPARISNVPSELTGWIGTTTTPSAVLKLQATFDARRLPARSAAPVVIVAAYSVRGDRFSAGVNIAAPAA